MKRYTVSIPREVKAQIFEQTLFIANDSIDNALAWEDRLFAAITAIGDAPGHAVDETASAGAGAVLHKMVFERTYLIHYQIDVVKRLVEVVSFQHGARLPRRRWRS